MSTPLTDAVHTLGIHQIPETEEDNDNDSIFYSRTPSPQSSNPSSPTQNQPHPHPQTIKPPPTTTKSDLPHLIRTQRTSGYRTGICAGRDNPSTAQAGFDEGYTLGGAAGVRAGWVLGCFEEVVRLRGRGDMVEDGQEEEGLRQELQQARRELDVRALLKEGADVVAEADEDVSKDTRTQRWLASLQVLRRWEGRVEELGRDVGVDLRYPG